MSTLCLLVNLHLRSSLVFSPSQSASPSIGRLPNNPTVFVTWDEFRTFDWWSDQTWTSLVGSMSAFGQQRSSGFQRWWGTKCLIFFPCFQKSFIQVNFVNLEKVEVLGLPGGEGELRVRGDKTVRSHNPLKLTGSRSFYISSSGL